MLQPKKTLTRVTRLATNDEATRFKAKNEGTPRLMLKKSQEYKDTPKSMPTKPASEVSSPKREFISKLNNATLKAKELGILDDKPKVKGTGAASSYQPTKSSSSYSYKNKK